jgi:hypothetical protein
MVNETLRAAGKDLQNRSQVPARGGIELFGRDQASVVIAGVELQGRKTLNKRASGPYHAMEVLRGLEVQVTDGFERTKYVGNLSVKRLDTSTPSFIQGVVGVNRSAPPLV